MSTDLSRSWANVEELVEEVVPDLIKKVVSVPSQPESAAGLLKALQQIKSNCQLAREQSTKLQASHQAPASGQGRQAHEGTAGTNTQQQQCQAGRRCAPISRFLAGNLPARCQPAAH
ncbi:hypothetical protein WJX72_010542 [[Myrmecia] bisecta]|uniref:Uncharacterized protein n=1 Tax=[Myrmecia] bisecta TaxID=41462 RepID=A0AAW1RAE2_9CHLO